MQCVHTGISIQETLKLKRAKPSPHAVAVSKDAKLHTAAGVRKWWATIEGDPAFLCLRLLWEWHVKAGGAPPPPAIAGLGI